MRDDLMHPKDRLTVIHVFDNSKTYLEPELRSDYIYRTTESQLLPYLNPNQYNLVWVPRDPAKSTRQQLVELAQFQRATIVVVGFHGRRGPKQDPTVMGSAVDFTLHSGNFSLLIVKNKLHRNVVPTGSFNWVILTDGSSKAEHGFRVAASIIRKEVDNVYVIHGRTTSETYKPHFDSLIAANGIRGTYFDLDIRLSSFTEELIVFLNTWEVRVDFTVFGAYGSTGSNAVGLLRVGSVTTDLIKNVRTNLLVVK